MTSSAASATSGRLHISVIGCGYLGTVHAAALASLGHTVVGIDTNAERVAELEQGRAPFFEPGLQQLLASGISSGTLTFSTDFADVAGASLHFLCVGTPQSEGTAKADLTYLFAASEALLPHLAPGSVVAGKSTVPVGTAARLAEVFAPVGAALVWNPEFLREGRAVEDSLHPDRLVFGSATDSEHALDALATAYAPIIAAGTPLIATDLATAELVKGAANAYLATRLSFMNAMAEVADRAGADITGLAAALGHDARIGPRYLGAGIGFGGGCLPKDIRAFAARSRELGALHSADLLEQVDRINLDQRDHTVAVITEHFGGDLRGHKITMLGAAFKPESDDIRDSPALDIAVALHAQGAVVTVTDPAALTNTASRFPVLRLESDLDSALSGAELVVLGTEWIQYRELDPVRTGGLVLERTVFDGRNCLDRDAWCAAGWNYRGIGRR